LTIEYPEQKPNLPVVGVYIALIFRIRRERSKTAFRYETKPENTNATHGFTVCRRGLLLVRRKGSVSTTLYSGVTNHKIVTNK